MLGRRERGMTLIGWLLVLGLIGFFVVVVLRLWPIYYEYFGVKRALGKFHEQSDAARISKDEIWKRLTKQFYIDGVSGIDRKESFSVEDDKGVRTITLTYERRTPMMGNVDAVVSFSESVTVRDRE